MNIVKKITPVYALQVVAVIFLFAYKGPVPQTLSSAQLTDKVLILEVKKQPQEKLLLKQLPTGEMNSLSILYTGLQNGPQVSQKKAAR